MATVQDTLDAIEARADYVPNSLFIKSWDKIGMAVKWLEYTNAPTNTNAHRHESFIWITTWDESKSLNDQTAGGDVAVDNPEV